MLEVAIHSDDVFAARMVEAGGKARSLAEISTKLHDSDAAVDRGNLAQHLEGAIGGTIVDEDDLKAVAVRLHDGLKPIVEVGDILLLVMQGYHNGILWHGRFYYTGKGGNRGFGSIL